MGVSDGEVGEPQDKIAEGAVEEGVAMHVNTRWRGGKNIWWPCEKVFRRRFAFLRLFALLQHFAEMVDESRHLLAKLGALPSYIAY